MKHSRLNIFLISILSLSFFYAGVFRHDVPEEEYRKLATERQFECVGQVFLDTSARGTCVLINDHFALSAAHIFIECDTYPDTMEINGNTFIVYVSYNQRVTDITRLYLVFKSQKVKVKSLIIHPNYLDSLIEGSCDLALIELERPLKNIIPATLNTAFDELNSIAVGVGYGASGPADRPDLVEPQSVKIAGENVIDSIGGQKYLGFKTLLICDFDHPTREDCNKLGSPIPRPLEYICTGGDSGGGLFRKNRQVWELIGICSGAGTDVEQLMKTGYYGQTMKWTRISPFIKWIQEQIR